MKVVNVVIVATLLIILGIVSAKSFGHGFKSDAGKWAVASFDHNNLITESDFITLEGNIMLVDLDGGKQIQYENALTLTIPSSDILEKQNFRKLKNFKGSIVLIDDDPAISARIWMILSQMGIKNLYILTKNSVRV